MFTTIIHKTLSESTAFSFCHGAGLMQGQRMLWAAAHSARIEDWLPASLPNSTPASGSPDKSLPRSLSPSPVYNTRVHRNGSKWYCSKKIHSSILMLFNHHATGTTLTQFMGISFYANPSIPVELLTQPQPHLLVSNPMEKPMNLYFICPQSFPGSL